MSYQIPSAVIPYVAKSQEQLKSLGLFRDKVDGKPAMSTWGAIDSALNELKTFRESTAPEPRKL